MTVTQITLSSFTFPTFFVHLPLFRFSPCLISYVALALLYFTPKAWEVSCFYWYCFYKYEIYIFGGLRLCFMLIFAFLHFTFVDILYYQAGLLVFEIGAVWNWTCNCFLVSGDWFKINVIFSMFHTLQNCDWLYSLDKYMHINIIYLVIISKLHV